MYSTMRSLPFLRDFPAEARRLTETALEDQEKRQRETSERRSRKAADLAEHAHRRRQDLLGSENLKSLRDLMTQESRAFRDCRQPPEGLNLIFDEANSARKAKGG